MRRTALLFALPAILAAADPAVKEVAFTTKDGFALKGVLTVPADKGPRPAVILAHQFRKDHTGWQALTDKLHAQGIATLALDLRGHGQSTQKAGATVAVSDDFKASAATVGFQHIPEDLVQAAQWLRKQKGIRASRIGLAGSSVGAFSVLLAAAQIKPVAVLALSPAGAVAFGDGAGEQLLRAAETSRSAIMAYASTEDGEAPRHAAALGKLYGGYARIVPGKDHGFAYLPAEATTMAGWFKEYLVHHHGMVAAAAPKAPEEAKELKQEPAPVKK